MADVGVSYVGRWILNQWTTSSNCSVTALASGFMEHREEPALLFSLLCCLSPLDITQALGQM